ncbi:finger with KRAB and SCAN domains 1-like isoform X1 [Podarcis lilfordi]|uniref:Finger with KRAB and SCAN domains 1-like isoform X1 n=1 Tax=Podarcis lilfordi TaxID=74358 RepID=A0AA35K115_9SAUR|nr:finger with KRAB and SCAN domains 1-like isoform X1 [Podarcis lilfordi]
MSQKAPLPGAELSEEENLTCGDSGEQNRCWTKMEKSRLGENLPKEMHRALAGEFRRDISAVTPGIPEEKNNSKGQQEKQPVKRETQCLSGVIAVSVSKATDGGKPCRRKYKSENPFECPASARDSQSVCCLEKLQGILRGEKQNALPACGENLCGREEFVGHQESHTEESSHECPKDEKRFRHRHRNNNSGRKPHECSVCGKNFTFRAELARHHRIHTGEKPYGCSQCGRSFRQRTHLVRHQSIHTGELFQCPECGKSFSQRDTLKRHQRTHRTLPRPASSEGGESSNRGSMFAVQAPAIPGQHLTAGPTALRWPKWQWGTCVRRPPPQLPYRERRRRRRRRRKKRDRQREQPPSLQKPRSRPPLPFPRRKIPGSRTSLPPKKVPRGVRNQQAINKA